MSHITDLIAAGDRLYSKRQGLMSFWGAVAEQFAPDLANFNGEQCMGEDYASDLMTSYPIMVARDLHDQLGSMLRPSIKDSAVMVVEGLEDHDGKAWLEWASKIQRRAMYDRAAQYSNTAKSSERFLTLFGQSVKTIQPTPDARLLYRPWHLRDVVWTDGMTGAVECVHRKWDTPTAYELARTFGEAKLHQKVRDHLRPGKDPYFEVKCRHIVIPADLYHGEHKYRTQLVELFIDVDNEHVIESTGQRINPYVIPRWQRDPGRGQYAISPAVTCALPEARMLQSMAFTIVQAGEKYVNPPLIAQQGVVVRDDIDATAGGIIWIESEYDERTGNALRPLLNDKSAMPIGMDLQARSELMIRKAFYADKLQLPQRGGPSETAYEVGQRVQQFIRDALPLFEPLEIESNGGDHERTFEVLARQGAFGPPDTWPKSLIGADIEFKFTSPLREDVRRANGRIFMDGLAIIQAGVALDPSVANIVDATTTMREVLEDIGYKTAWLKSPEAVRAAADAEQEQAEAQAMLTAMGQAAGIAKDLGSVPGIA